MFYGKEVAIGSFFEIINDVVRANPNTTAPTNLNIDLTTNPPALLHSTKWPLWTVDTGAKADGNGGPSCSGDWHCCSHHTSLTH